MDCMFLLDFAKEIYKIEFHEKPDYNKLRFLLTKEMLKKDLTPTQKFDWNKFEQPPRSINNISDKDIINYNISDFDEHYSVDIPIELECLLE